MTKDIAPNVYCNNQKLAWDNARRACENAKGTFMAYETGLGMDVANLSLTNETDIWTADYAWEPIVPWNSERLCGFRKIDHGKLYSEEMYGYCGQPRYFVCKNDSTKGLNVFFGERNSVNCPDVVFSSFELQSLPPGFYWTSNIVNLIKDTWPSHGSPWHHPVFCGAYKEAVGKYFGDCVRKRVSLCRISMYAAAGNHRNSFDKSCFEHWPIRSTPKTASKTPQSTHAVLNTMAQSTVMQRKTSSKSVAAPVVTTATKTTVMQKKTSSKSVSAPIVTTTTTTTTTMLHHVIRSKHPGIVSSMENGGADKQSETDSNVGVTVGLLVGLGIVLICGIILSIFFIRRYKRKPDKRSPRSKVFWNSAYSTKEESSRFNKNSKSSSVPIVEKGNGKSEKIQGDSLKNKDTEYAVVHKNNRCLMEQDRTETSLSKEKHGNLNKPGLDETLSNYYDKVGKNEYANQFAESDAMHTSAYSFVKETADDNGDNKGKTATVIEDEYDVTNCTHNNKSSNNIYNTLQSGDYGLFSHVRADETDYNVLSTPQSLASDTVYDSAQRIDHSTTVDDTYNHMTEPDTYGSTSINSGRKQQHRDDTDQTYDKLNFK